VEDPILSFLERSWSLPNPYKSMPPLEHQRLGKEDRQKVVPELTFTYIFVRRIHGKLSTDYSFWLLVCLSADRIPNVISTILFDLNRTSVSKTFVK
jgi:hypothetical protein